MSEKDSAKYKEDVESIGLTLAKQVVKSEMFKQLKDIEGVQEEISNEIDLIKLSIGDLYNLMLNMRDLEVMMARQNNIILEKIGESGEMIEIEFANDDEDPLNKLK